MHRRTLLLLLGSIALAASLAAGVFLSDSFGPRLQRQGALYVLTRGDCRYHFDAAWRTESLWRKDAAGNWVLQDSPPESDLARFRSFLLESTGADGLEGIPAEGVLERKALESLGYI